MMRGASRRKSGKQPIERTLHIIEYYPLDMPKIDTHPRSTIRPSVVHQYWPRPIKIPAFVVGRC